MVESKRGKIIILAAVIIIIIAASVLLWKFIGAPLIDFVSEPERFREWIDKNGAWSRIAFIGMVLFQVVVAVIPGEPFEIAAGYAFGAAEGTLLCMFASAAGSVIIYQLVRIFGIKFAKLFFSEEKLASLRFLKINPKRAFLFLIIYMIPGTPKDLLNYYAGLTDMKFVPWLFICSLGRFPSIVTSVIGGNALGTRDYWKAAIVFIIALLISGAGLFIYNRICNKHNKAEEK